MKRLAVVAAAALLLVAGCSGGADGSAPPAATASGSASGSASVAPSSPPVGGEPGAPAAPASPSGEPCPPGQPSGTYALEEFAGQGATSMGSGKGGDILVTFADGTYRMSAKGAEPMITTIKDQSTGELIVDGTITGSYDKTGAVRTFRVGSGKGTAHITSGGRRAELDFDQLTRIIGLDGRFALACKGDRLAVVGVASVFSLAKA